MSALNKKVDDRIANVCEWDQLFQNKIYDTNKKFSSYSFDTLYRDKSIES